MTELEIDVDEGILLESDEAALISDGEQDIEWLVLTDKNIHIVTSHRTGLFSSEQQVQVIPLSTIKIVKGKPLVAIKDTDEYRHCLQIQSTRGIDWIYFYGNSKKNASTWITEIYELLGAEYVPDPTITDSVFSGIAGIAAGFKQALDEAARNAPTVAREAMGDVRPSNTNEIPAANKTTSAFSFEQSETSHNIGNKYCRHCGHAIPANSKFCPECGEKNSDEKSDPPPTTEPVQVAQQPQPDLSQRRIEYQGVLYKCPNCGGEVDSLDAVCDFCGCRISGRAANATVLEFNRQLMAIESTRKRRKILSSELLDVTDKQIISLINTFPIPNNVEELTEFMFMSVSNVNPQYSKKGIFSSSYSSTPEGAISNAWLSKMQQVYKKAEIAFSDDPLFEQIKETYESKMHELKRM